MIFIGFGFFHELVFNNKLCWNVIQFPGVTAKMPGEKNLIYGCLSVV
jgi:hypothetical protein